MYYIQENEVHYKKLSSAAFLGVRSTRKHSLKKELMKFHILKNEVLRVISKTALIV